MTDLYKQVSLIENGKRVHKKVKLKQKEIDALNPSNEMEKCEILSKLKEIDMKSIRALRANETDKLIALENDAIALREQLNSIK